MILLGSACLAISLSVRGLRMENLPKPESSYPKKEKFYFLEKILLPKVNKEGDGNFFKI